MSSGLEPHTSASCLFRTSKGVLAVELWAKECPQTCRLLLQKCVDRGFEGREFELCSDLTGLCVRFGFGQRFDGGEKLPLESNERLRFNVGGLIGWNIKLNELVFTLKPFAVRPKGITLIGKLVNQSDYVLKEIFGSEKQDGDDMKFLYPAVVEKVEVSEPYFNDLVKTEKTSSDVSGKPKIELKKKLLKFNKVAVSYDLDDESDDDLPQISGLPNKKMKLKLPPGLSGSNAADVKLFDDDKTGSFDMDKKTVLDKGNSLDQEEELSARERETMALLDDFQHNVTNKVTLKKKKK